MKKLCSLALLAVFALLFAVSAWAGATEVTWYGQSGFKIKTPTGKVLLIDPWISNPKNPDSAKIIAGLGKVDYVLLTHGHFDHVGNTQEIVKKFNAKVVANFDLLKALQPMLQPQGKSIAMENTGSFGGKITLADGEVEVGFVPAVHGSSIENMGAAPSQGGMQYAGLAGGFWIGLKDGPTFYHTGDTDVFSDMAFVNLFGPVDVMLVPIGDKFTMGPVRAAQAVKLVSPKIAVPMHYGTIPVLTGTPEVFGEELKMAAPKTELKVLKIGEATNF